MNYFFSNKVNTFHVLSDLELEESICPNTLALIDSFNRGYEVGLTWHSAWLPGGPDVYTPSPHNAHKEKFIEKSRQSRAEYDAWHMGWEAGRQIAGAEE